MRALLAAVVCLAILLPSAGGGQSPPTCTPVFEPTPFNRGLPHAYADQGLQSIPLIYPKHEMLAQRRVAEAGPVVYSLLVYRKDAALDAITIEGVAVHEQRAWRFTATCDARLAWDALVATIERVAALPRDPGKR